MRLLKTFKKKLLTRLELELKGHSRGSKFPLVIFCLIPELFKYLDVININVGIGL